MMSRGTIMAWIPDPSVINPADTEDYYLNSARRLIVVPPGTALMVFPHNSLPDPAVDRIESARTDHYWLAVTKNGFWGIIEVATSGGNANLLIGEIGLKAIAQQEANTSDSSYIGMLSSAAADGPTANASSGNPIGLTRGELFRVVSDDGSQSTIDFGGLIASLFDRGAKIPANIRSNTYLIDDSNEDSDSILHIQVFGPLVPAEDLSDWEAGHGDYYDIFNKTFADLRIPGAGYVEIPCGTTITTEYEQSTAAAIDASVSFDPSGHWLDDVIGNLNLAASGSSDFKDSLSKASETISLISEDLYPAEYRAPSGDQSEDFWVGTASTCKLESPIRSLVVVDPDPQFLHFELDGISKSTNGYIPAGASLTQPDLNSMIGGDPILPNGTVFAKCMAQLIALQRLAQQTMNGLQDYEFQAAIALASGRQIGSVDFGRFFSDKACETQLASSTD
jgi:hypothetical protein